LGEDSISKYLSSSLGLDLPQVELELLALQHIPIGPSALSGTGGNGSKHTTGHKLIKESLLNLALLLSLGVLGLGLLGPLLVNCSLLGISELGTLLSSEWQSVMGLVPKIIGRLFLGALNIKGRVACWQQLIVEPLPLPEGSSIDDHDGVLHESLGSDQLIVTSIVDNINDPGLAGNSFRSPGEVTSVKPESSVLLVSSPDPEGVDPLGGQLGHGSRPGQLELPLLPDGAFLSSSGPALMPVIS